jgi:hypothetical protein
LLLLLVAVTVSACSLPKSNISHVSSDISSSSSLTGISEQGVNNISAMLLEDAIDAGYVVQVNGSRTGGYYFDKLDSFLKSEENGTPASIYVTCYDGDAQVPQQTVLYYLQTDGTTTYLYNYKNNNSTFTCENPVKIDKIVKTATSDSGDDYQTQGSLPETNIDLITAKNVISPTSAKDCVLDYEKALHNKDGIMMYYLTSHQKGSFSGLYYAGVSSPYIAEYTVGDPTEKDGVYTVNGTLTWRASGGPDVIDKGIYTVISENEYFRITKEEKVN